MPRPSIDEAWYVGHSRYFNFQTVDCNSDHVFNGIYFWSHDFQPIICVEKCALNNVMCAILMTII